MSLLTARNVSTIVSLITLGATLACTNFYEVPIETPIQAKLDIGGFTRVLVAGFITGGSDEVDANLETVRLLRSQLRTKSNLKVIEADVLPLAQLALDPARTNWAATATPNTTGLQPVSDVPAQSVSTQEKPPATQQPDDPKAKTQEGKIQTEKDLDKYQSIFADVAFWKKIGEEYQQPLIVTGTILFTSRQTQGFVNQPRETIDEVGRRTTRMVRVYVERKGFVLAPKWIFIDGRTGTVIYQEGTSEERLYPTMQNTPALSSYFEMMDSLLPSFLGTLSNQKVRGTRTLLR